MFGSHRRLFRLCENVTDLPKNGFLPQISQIAAIAERGYQTTYGGRRQAAIAVEVRPQVVCAELRRRPWPTMVPVRVVEDRHRLADASRGRVLIAPPGRRRWGR